MTRFRSRRLVCCLTVAAAIAAGGGAVATQARAALPTDAVSDATAQAKVLQAQVAELQTQAEEASEKYDAAQSELGALVVQERAAEQKSDAAQAASDADNAAIERRARALYMSGGVVGLYGSILGSNDPSQISTGLRDLQALAASDAQTLSIADSSTDAVQRSQDSVSELLAKQDQLTAEVSDSAAAVSQALATQQGALASANAQVVAAEKVVQAQIDAANAAAAAKALAAAEAAATAAGFASVGANVAPGAVAAIEAAQTQLGKPYLFGGSGPDSWDCSGLTQWSYAQAGIALPRTAAEQYAAIPLKIPLGQLEPGDLLFWATDLSDPSTIHHVAIYLGNGMMLAAPHTGTVVQVQPVYLDGYIGAVRPTM